MRLIVKVIPLRAGASEPAAEPRMLACPPDVEPDTILSFLTQQLGEPIEAIWTSTERDRRIDTGWIFPGIPAIESQDAVELACVPFLETADGALQLMFEVQADQRQQFAELAASRGLDYTIIERPQRAYQPTDGQTGQDAGTPRPWQAGSLDQLDQALAGIARQTGATLRIYPRPGHAARRIVLRDDRDDLGTRYLDAALEKDGTLRITGHDQGPRVSEFFGEAITSYEWVYVVTPNRLPALIQLLGGYDGDDVLALLAAWHEHAGGQLSDVMQRPDVAAAFSNWHS
jgi:hypothetical protein